MTERSVLERIATDLAAAYVSGEAVPPPTDDHPDLGIDDAYEIQRLQVARWLDEGEEIAGYKIGLTSRAMQLQLGVDQPDFGCVPGSKVSLSGEVVETPLLQPRIEPELAFVLSKEIAPPITFGSVAASIDHVLPALEIVDSRVRDWRILLPDTIADNASLGAVILGGNPRRLDSVDLQLTGCNLHVNGELAGTGATGAVLGNPLNAVTWLARELASRGVTMAPGSVVLSGACLAAAPVGPGDAITAEFGGMGTVTAVLSKKEEREANG